MKIRLNRYLSICGISSRRKADELIRSNKVRVNSKIIKEVGHTVDPEKDKVEVNNKTVKSERKRYIILNKPKLYITTLASSEDGKESIVSLITGIKERVFPVGRLDFDTEGLLLLTNDGEFANRIHHPRYQVIKVYLAKVKGHVHNDKLAKISKGTKLDNISIKPDSIEIKSRTGVNSTLRISFHEGKKHLVKRYLKSFDNPVVKLKRVEIGGVKLGKLQVGKWRDLTQNELKKLKIATGLEPF